MVNRDNYLMTKSFLKYLQEVVQISQSSESRYSFYLKHLLLWADDVPFSKNKTIRPTFPVYLTDGLGDSVLAPSTQKKILEVTRRFFFWALENYSQRMKGINKQWVETLRLIRQPQESKENTYVSLEEVRSLITVPAAEGDFALLRDKAAASMLFLSGMRAGAFVTLPISAVHLDLLKIQQWPELGVHTKNGKKATTYLYDIPELLAPVKEWDAIVRLGLPETSCWYAPINHVWGEQILSLNDPGKHRVQGLGKRLKKLFSLAHLDFKSAHKFRHGNAVYGLKMANTMADYKAISQNLMHESIEITDSIYAPLLSSDVKDRIHAMTDNKSLSLETDLEKFISNLSRDELLEAVKIIGQNL